MSSTTATAVRCTACRQARVTGPAASERIEVLAEYLEREPEQSA